ANRITIRLAHFEILLGYAAWTIYLIATDQTALFRAECCVQIVPKFEPENSFLRWKSKLIPY
ncbi:MAG: hypothetical protein K2Q45_08695, partial [Nitrosomonas sp.]|nr:hypothetical protein [Nitrosomonas sp.]